MSNLCKSCGAPLSDFKQEQVKGEFCPYCVNRVGKLKKYKDVLTGMIEYIKDAHPEITEANRASSADEMLRKEGVVWTQEFLGVVMDDQVKNIDKLFSVLKEKKLAKLTKSEKGFFIKVERADIDYLVKIVKKHLLGGASVVLAFESENITIKNNLTGRKL